MKTIQLTPQQRKDISGRRRQAQDRRIFQRLSAVLWSDDGRSREEIAQLTGVSTRQVGQWFRIFRNKGLDELCTLHYQGDPGRLGPAQVKRIRQEIETGVFHNADQIRTWIESTFGVTYSASGVKDLLRRIGASFHKVSGFFWKAEVQDEKKFLRKRRRHKRQAGTDARRYLVDPCPARRRVGLLYAGRLRRRRRLPRGVVWGLAVRGVRLVPRVSNLGFARIDLPVPVFAGDTIHVVTEVIDTRASKSRPDTGIVTFEHQGLNQRDELVCRSTRTAMMHCVSPAADD